MSYIITVAPFRIVSAAGKKGMMITYKNAALIHSFKKAPIRHFTVTLVYSEHCTLPWKKFQGRGSHDFPINSKIEKNRWR